MTQSVSPCCNSDLCRTPSISMPQERPMSYNQYLPATAGAAGHGQILVAGGRVIARVQACLAPLGTVWILSIGRAC